MPIHDQSYRRYQGLREPSGQAWTVIAGTGIRSTLAQRRFLLLLLLAWAPFAVRTVQFYFATTFPQATMLAPSTETFREFLDQQGFFIFIVTIYVGAGLVANDRRANALQIYLSKPLTRTEYIAGKLAVLAAFLLLVTWLPGILLLLAQVVLAGSLAFLRDHLFLVPAITVFTFIEVLLASMSMLALSSLSKSARFAGVLYAGLVLFSDALFSALRATTGASTLSWISFPATLAQLGDVIFRLRPRYDTPWPVSLLVVALLMGVSLWVLERRIRGVEVVT